MDSARPLAASTLSSATQLQNANGAILTGLGAALSNGKSDSGMFAALLSTVQTETPAATPAAPQPAQNTANMGSTADGDAAASDAATKKSGVRHGSFRLAKPDAAQTQQAASAAPTNKPVATATQTTQADQKAAQQTSDDEQDASTDAEADADDAQGDAGHKKSAAVMVAATTTADAAARVAASTTATTDDLTHNQQLLASLALVTPNNLSSVSSVPMELHAIASVSTGTGAKGELQGLLGAIKSGADGKEAATDAAAAATDGGSDSEAASSAKTAAAATSGKTDALSDAFTNLSPATADETAANFFDVFKNAFADSATATALSTTAVTANAVTGASGSKDGGLDMDMQRNGGSDVGANIAATSTTEGVAADNATLKTSASTYSFASQLATARASATGLPPAVEQVAFQLNRSVKAGDDQMTLQLNPAELGKINIKLSISTDGKVQGTVIADNPATLHMMVKDQATLERALQDAGLSTTSGSLQFSLGGQSGQSFQQANNGHTASNTAGTVAANTGDVIATTVADTYYITPNGVNLRV